MTDQGELDFLVRDARQSGTLVCAPQGCPLGQIFTYYDGSQPQYTNLRARMLGYANINLLSMLARFKPQEAARIATDNIYIQKTALRKLEGVGAYVASKLCDCCEYLCVCCLFGEAFLPLYYISGPSQVA